MAGSLKTVAHAILSPYGMYLYLYMYRCRCTHRVTPKFLADEHNNNDDDKNAYSVERKNTKLNRNEDSNVNTWQKMLYRPLKK